MAVLLPIFIVAAIIWAMWLTPRLALPILASLFLITASVIGYDIWNFQVGISMSVDRFVLLAMVGACAVHLFLRRTQAPGIHISEWILLGFMALLIGNTFLHDWRRDTPDQIPILQHLIEGYVIPCILYWIGSRAQLSERVVDGVYVLFGILGIYLSVTALCEIAGWWGLVYPRKIADPTVGLHFGRARGPFLQSVRLGIYLLTCFFMIWTGLVWRSRWGRWGRLLGLALTPLFLAAMLATLTRSVWLGFGVATVTLFYFALEGRVRRAAMVSVFFGALIAGVLVQGDIVTFKREKNSQDTAQSTNMRTVFTYVSYLMIKDRPFTGFGFGHFPHEKEIYLGDRSTDLELESIRGYIHHNSFLSVFVELGLFGFLALCALLISWWRRAKRLWQEEEAPNWMRGQALVTLMLITAFAVQMVFHEVSYSTIENGILFLMAGMTGGLASKRSPEPSLRKTLREWFPLRIPTLPVASS